MNNQLNTRLRVRDITALLGVGRITLYGWIQSGTFPSPHTVDGPGSRVCWHPREVEGWLESRMNGMHVVPQDCDRRKPSGQH